MTDALPAYADAHDLLVDVRAMVQTIAGSGAAPGAERLALIGALEELKGATEGLQLELAAQTLITQREQAERSGPHAAARVAASVGHQVALARRAAPTKGRAAVQLAMFVRASLPKVYAALRAGATCEWTVSLIARETAVLSQEHRAAVDEALAAEPARLTLLGPHAAQARARQLVAELDPAAVVARRHKAESERHVSLRPAPDGMTWLSALLPLTAGVATLAVLTHAADSARAAGDERSRGQVMADELASRVTGTTFGGSIATEPADAECTDVDPTDAEPTGTRLCAPTARPAPADGAFGSPGNTFGSAAADPTRWGGAYSAAKDRAAREATSGSGPIDSAPAEPPSCGDTSDAADSGGVGVMINLIMTDQQLFGTGPASEGTAWCEGYGPIDADLARELARGAPAAGDRRWLRRLFADRAGRLAAMDSRARLFPAGVRTLIKLRDQVCRSPWCNAPIRHIDHVVDHAQGGATSVDNAQGTCEACNYAKQAPGWTTSACPVSGRITVKTPGGQTYSTLPPPPPGTRYRRVPYDIEMVFTRAA